MQKIQTQSRKSEQKESRNEENTKKKATEKQKGVNNRARNLEHSKKKKKDGLLQLKKKNYSHCIRSKTSTNENLKRKKTIIQKQRLDQNRKSADKEKRKKKTKK